MVIALQLFELLSAFSGGTDTEVEHDCGDATITLDGFLFVNQGVGGRAGMMTYTGRDAVLAHGSGTVGTEYGGASRPLLQSHRSCVSRWKRHGAWV